MPEANIRLQQARRETGWTQEEVADKVGIDPNTYSRWERGYQQPHPYHRQKLCDLFGKTEQELGLDTSGSEAQAATGQERQEAELSLSQVSQTIPLSDRSMQETPLIGREEELAKICRELLQERGFRVVTLTGPPGVGKTHLALKVGRELKKHYLNRYAYISLADHTDPADVIPKVVSKINSALEQNITTWDEFSAALQENDFLLILDNFEQFLTEEHALAAIDSITSLIENSEKLKILLTSRAALHVELEQPFEVIPLAFPSPGQFVNAATLEDERYPATKVYLLFARQVSGGKFSPANHDAPFIAALCYLLDGLPLAIQLVASRIETYPPERAYRTLLEKPADIQILENRYYVDTPARHISLKEALDWSYDLLTEEQQKLFRRVAVFMLKYEHHVYMYECKNYREGWYAYGACSINNDLHGDILTLMQSLAYFHLLEIGTSLSGGYFSMLQVIQEYAIQQALEIKVGETNEAEIVYAQTLPIPLAPMGR